MNWVNIRFGLLKKVYLFYSGDQSACPKCVKEAEQGD